MGQAFSRMLVTMDAVGEDDEDSDAALLHAWRQGNARAGHRLCSRYYEAVVRFFANKVTEDLCDRVQDTFKACVEGRERIGQSFPRYLFGVAYRIFQGYLRRKYRMPQEQLVTRSIRDIDPGPSTLLRKSDEQHRLLQALRELPVEIQTALELTYWEGMSSTDVAIVLGIASSTVRSHLRRGRSMLEAKMKGDVV